MRRAALFLTALALLVSGSASPAFSQGRAARFVAVESAPVRSSTGFFAQTVGAFALGDEVALVRESGRWSEVSAGGLTGWVASASLSPRPVLRAGSSVTPGEVALAGKGFGREVEGAYRAGTGLEYSYVDAMESVAISAEELWQFVVEGRLSRGEQ